MIGVKADRNWGLYRVRDPQVLMRDSLGICSWRLVLYMCMIDPFHSVDSETEAQAYCHIQALDTTI